MSTKRERTRTSILEAAWKRLQRGDPARLEDIAADAGVTRQSVYLHFKSRGGLLIALVAYIDETIDLPSMIAEARAATDPAQWLELTLRIAATVAPKIHGVAMALVQLAPTDPDAAAALEDRMSQRRKGLAEVTARLDAASVLAPGWTPKHAAEALGALISPANYEELVVQRGWSVKAYEKWLVHLGRSFLIAPPA